MRRLLVLPLLVVLAACGGSKHGATTTTPTTPRPPGQDALFESTDGWAVSLTGTKATAYHLVGRTWRPDRSGEPQLDILGPKPGSTVAPIPQVAFQVTGKTDLVDTAMWVDGHEVLGKGGGLTPKKGTIYGALQTKLKPGRHVAVAYARTATHAAAVAWVFHV
jgi:hypothetical protein